MMRYDGLLIALCDSSIVDNHWNSFWTAVTFSPPTAHPAAGLSPPLKPPVRPSASNKPSWVAKQTAGSTALTRPKQGRSEGQLKVKTLTPFNPLGLFFSSSSFFLLSTPFIFLPLPHQMTPVHLGTEQLGKLAFQGSWGGPLKRKLLQGSRSGFGWMTVHLHPLTGSV